MKQFDEFLMMVKACGDDVMFDGEDGEYDLTYDDFGGFDEDWGELDRQYDNPVEVEALDNWIHTHCNHYNGCYYVSYYFEDFFVTVGYTSMDV